MEFVATKLALFIGPQLLVYQRDDFAEIPFPGMWDLPGGGREGGESPEQCVMRETFEEFGLRLTDADITWRRDYPSGVDPTRRSVFFAAHLAKEAADDIVFGQEGQQWRLVPPGWFLTAAAPEFLKGWLRDYLETRNG